jgi:sec-independent protein translocase protein TatB
VIDIGVTKLAIIGGIALVVIGPEKLPALAKTIGTLMGRARRYVADVKAEVNRSMDLDELKKMKENTIQSGASDFEKTWGEATNMATTATMADAPPSFPFYKHPKKKWRVKQGATPNWYKAKSGTRTKALSGAARVARFRPKQLS